MITSGFYNSLAGDRKYNSVQISRLFEGIINDGVFASIGESLMVVASSGMTVNVGTGRAWFNNTWTDNDADIPLTLDAAEAILNRIDAIVLEVGSASDVRANTIKIVKGTPGSVPVAPTMIQTTGKYQYPLATIYVGAGVTSITSGNITSKINTTECPFVKVIGIEALTPIWENEFNTWFAALQAQMAGDVATNLQNQINTKSAIEIADKTKYGTCTTAAATVAKVVTQTEFSFVTGAIVGVTFTNLNTAANPTLNINATGAKAVQCCGVAAVSGQIPKMAAFQYDGTYFQLLNPAYPPGIVPVANGGTGSSSGAAAIVALGIDLAIAAADKLAHRDSYLAFCANVNTTSLDVAFGKMNEDLMFGIGLQLAMYAWFKGDSKVTYPFTTLKTKQTFLDCYSTAYNEIRANLTLLTLIAASVYAKDVCKDYIPFGGIIPCAFSGYDFISTQTQRAAGYVFSTVTIPVTGIYNVQVRSNRHLSSGGTLGVNFNGVSQGTFSVDDAGFSKNDCYLTAGTVITLVAVGIVSTGIGVISPLIVTCIRPIAYPTTPVAGNRVIQFNFTPKYQARGNSWASATITTPYTFDPVPNTGTYRVQYQYDVYESGTVYFADQLIIEIKRNGVAAHTVSGIPNAVIYPTQVVADIACNAGDVITITYRTISNLIGAIGFLGATLSISATDNFPV